MKVILCEERQGALEEMKRQMLLVMEELNFSSKIIISSKEALRHTCEEVTECLLIMGVSDGQEAALVQELHKKYPNVLVIWAVTSPEEVPQLEADFVMGWFVCPLDRIRMCKLVSRYLYEKRRNLGEEVYYVRNSVGTVQMKLAYDRIEYAESQGNQIVLHLTNGQNYRIYERMKNLEKELHDRRFLKCHQSYLVNMDHVKSIDDVFLMKSGARVLIRQREKKHIRELYFRFLVEER